MFSEEKRLLNLTKDLINSLPIDNFISVEFSDNDLTHYKAIIKGPIDSPFQDALFTLDVSYPDGFPFQPPKVKFDDKIFHPNVDLNTGKISLDILSHQ
jgi:ubiquitin-protein ligase